MTRSDSLTCTHLQLGELCDSFVPLADLQEPSWWSLIRYIYVLSFQSSCWVAATLEIEAYNVLIVPFP